MKRIKFNIIYLIGLLILSASLVITFAAFIFNQVVNMDADLGGISIESKNFLVYAKDHSLPTTNINYERAEKLRKDTVATVEGIKLAYTSSYAVTDDKVAIDGKIYYQYDGANYNIVNVNVGASTQGYFEEVKSYTNINSIDTLYDSSFNDITPTITNKQFSFVIDGLTITVDCTVSATEGTITSATVTATNKNYKASIGVSGLTMVIIDLDVTSSSSGYRAIDCTETERITCSATELKYYAEGETGKKYYLSQIGLQFSFKADIAVYVRISIKDAWLRTRAYSSSTKELYVLKDKDKGSSPFKVINNEWYYDEINNYVYLKDMYVPRLVNGELETKSYTFDVNEAYYYNATKSSAFTDYINVDVSFTVDIIQANRAKAVWKVDPSVDFRNNN